LSYATAGLHMAAFAAGSMIAGAISAALERALGRRALFWSAAALMGAGAIGLTAGRTAEVTVGSVLVMGVGGGLVLVTVHAVLADHHGEFRTVALAEENVAASIAYLALIGALSVAAALQLGWRAALLASWSSRSWPGAAAGGSRLTRRTHHLSWGTPPRRVLDRGRNAVLHHRRRMVRHRLGCGLRHSRRRCVSQYCGWLDGRLLRVPLCLSSSRLFRRRVVVGGSGK